MDRSTQGILILGPATSFIGEAIELAEECGLWICGLVTNLPDQPAVDAIRGYPVIPLRELPSELRGLPAICILGTPECRHIVLADAQQAGIDRFVSLIHPAAFVARSAQIGKGCLVNMRATIASGVVIGDHVVMNRGVLIGHDNVLESFKTVAGQVSLSWVGSTPTHSRQCCRGF